MEMLTQQQVSWLRGEFVRRPFGPHIIQDLLAQIAFFCAKAAGYKVRSPKEFMVGRDESDGFPDFPLAPGEGTDEDESAV